MGKIAGFEYPAHTFTKCKDIVEKIWNDKISQREVLASKLEHKSKSSGSFKNKLTSLRRYGLLMEDQEGLELTETGEKIAKPMGESEKNRACKEAILNVNLLARLWDRVGSDIPESGELWSGIVEITDASRSVAEKEESEIRKLYMDAVKYLKAEKEEKMPSEKERERTFTTPSTNPPMPSLTTGENELIIHIPWNESAISFASNQIKDWLKYAEQQVKEKSSTEKEKG